MGAHKQGDGQKAGNRPKAKAPCRADTRGGSWAGIPKCLIDSAAYRDLSLHARAVLIEIVARMNGGNNGEIAISRRELMEALGCTSRYIQAALQQLRDNGMVDLAAEGQWAARQSRLYRLTFVSTKTAPATNEYLRWTPKEDQSRGSQAEPDGGQAGALWEPGQFRSGSQAEPANVTRLRRDPHLPGSHRAPLISKPYPPVPPREHKGDCGPHKLDGPKNGPDDKRACEHCREPFEIGRADRAYPRRFCSERCQRASAAKRAYHRKAHGDDAVAAGAALPANVHRLIAGGRA